MFCASLTIMNVLPHYTVGCSPSKFIKTFIYSRKDIEVILIYSYNKLHSENGFIHNNVPRGFL